MSRYASSTSVSVPQSQVEIQSILRKYGANRFGTMEDEQYAYVMFEYHKLMIQIRITKPDEKEFQTTATGRARDEYKIQQEVEQAIKQRWRALLLAVKAKLEAVESGISTIEQEFMAFVVMPDGQTLAEHIIPRLAEIAETGKMPKMLMAASYQGGNHAE